MNTILLFKQDLERYGDNQLETLRRHFGLPIAPREDLTWLLAIHQARGQHRSEMPSKPTVYIVTGSPGSGKSTAVKRLKEQQIIPQDVLIIDRDLITEQNTDLDTNLAAVKLQYDYDLDVLEMETHTMMNKAFRDTRHLYEDEITAAVKKQEDFLVFIPPHPPAGWAEILVGYRVILIFVYLEPHDAYQRAKTRAKRQEWLPLNAADVYCGWEAALKMVRRYCLTGKCYICDNRGRQIKCMDLDESTQELPSVEELSGPYANRAAQLCQLEQKRVDNYYDTLLDKEAEHGATQVAHKKRLPAKSLGYV